MIYITKIIVLCGGISSRWNNYLGVEKHFAQFNNCSIIENTLNILSTYNVSISILVREDNLHLYTFLNQDLFTISRENAILEFYKIKATYNLWSNSGKTIILMGDVWFTANALKRIINSRSTKLLFWGRQKKNYHTNCKHGELFALSFYPSSHNLLKSATSTLENLILNEGVEIAGGWGIYNIISGLSHLMSKERIVKGKALFSNFNNILDITDDIDTPKDYENIKLTLSVSHIEYLLRSIKMKFHYFLITIYNIFFELLRHC